jgi:hypothetical protein
MKMRISELMIKREADSVHRARSVCVAMNNFLAFAPNDP